MASSTALRRRESPAEHALDAGPLASLRLVSDLPDGAGAPRVAPAAPHSIRLPGSDEQLAACVSEEGQAPFAILYERHRADLGRYCLSVLRDRDDAADAANEAWLRAFAALCSPRMRPISFRAWLYSIARNACTDRLRERARFSLQELSDDDLGGEHSASELHETRQTVRLLLGDLAVLSERQRSAISLREVAGLSLDEIAVALETTPSKVMTLIAEARRVLHERQAGRRLPCDAVRRRIDMLRVNSHRIRAHLDDCVVCRAHHASTRGRRLSSLGLLPLVLLRRAFGRAGHLVKQHGAFGSLATKLAATGSVAVIAGTAVAVHDAGRPAVRGHSAAARHGTGVVVPARRRPVRIAATRARVARGSSRPHGLAKPTTGSVRVASPTASAAQAQRDQAVSPPGITSAPHGQPPSPLRSTVQSLVKRTAPLIDLGSKTTATLQQTAKTLGAAVGGAPAALKSTLGGH